MTNFTTIGKVTRTHGLKGEIFIRLEWPKAPWIDSLANLRLVDTSDNSEPQDIPVLTKRPHKEGLLVTFKGFDSIEKVEGFRGYTAQIPMEHFNTEDKEDFYLSEVVGFQVLSPALQNLGEIIGFENGPNQDRAILKLDAKTYQVPFVRAFWKSLDFETRKIVMDIPDGLVDLNL